MKCVPLSKLVVLLFTLASAGSFLLAAESPTRVVRKDVTLGGVAPAKDDTLLMWYADDPDTFNVVTASDNVSDAMHRRACEPLAERSFENPDVWKPVLAESWTFDDKNLEYTIKLRKGVMWHPITRPDGTVIPPQELTARDVKFTFDCILNKNIEAAHIRSYYEDPQAKDESKRSMISVSTSLKDKYTVKVKWTKPYFLHADYTLFGSHIIPRHVFSMDEKGQPISLDFSSKEFADGFNKHWANNKLCGTGPLILKEWKRQDRIVFERNPNYWAEPSFFSQVIYLYNTNPNTVLQKVLQREWDYAGIAEKDLYIQTKDHAAVKSGDVNLMEFTYPAYRYIGYNRKRPLFQDKRVRTAIGHAVPVDQIIEKLYHGLAIRSTGPTIPGSSSYDSSLKPLEFDLAKARTLLDEAGWKDSDDDGTRDKRVAGEKVDAVFDLMIYSDAPQYQVIAELVKENCQKIGIKVNISPAKWALMLQKLRKKEFDASMLGWVLDWKQDPMQLWHGSQAELPESSNSIGFNEPEADKIIEELRTTLEPEKQNELLKKFHRLIYDDQPYTFLFSDMQTSAADSRLKNIKYYKIRPAFDNRQWYSTKARSLR